MSIVKPRRAPKSSLLVALGEREDWLKEQAATSAQSRAQTIRDLEDLGSREETTQRDYVGRYPLELLQNAHDACASAGIKGTVHFEVTRTALIVANYGRPFDAKRIRSLVRQGMSEKADHERKRTIGYKGIGFSSVFEISQTPQIICANGVAFGFDRERAKAQVVEHLRPRKTPRTVAARNFPFIVEPNAWGDDREVVDRFFSDGFATVVRLPLRSGRSARSVYNHIVDQFVAETMVFLPAVNCLRCRYGDDGFEWTARSGNRAGIGKVVHVDANDGRRVSWLIHSGATPVAPALIDALEDPAWRSVGQLRVTVGLPWAGRRVDPDAADEPVHVYFPTSERTGRSCLVHGDFYVDSRRSQIIDRGAAAEINQAAAREAARLIAELAESLAPKQAPQLFAALAVTGTPSSFGRVLNEEIVAALRASRIGRPADGGDPRRIAELALVTSDQATEFDDRLMAVMSKRRDLMRVDDYDHDRALRLVRELGVNELGAEETAARVTIANSKLSYERGLVLLREWVANLSYQHREAVIRTLRLRNIVQDVDGRWCAPKDAVLSAAGFPPLPERLRRRELRPVKLEAAHDFLVEDLEVEDLDASAALELIDEALSSNDFGESGEDKKALQDWLLSLWRSAPKAFAGPRILRGRAPVRVRTATGASETWAHATSSYFGSNWTPQGAGLELLYGPDERHEFLADSPGLAQEELTSFYSAIGVAVTPRRYRVSAPHAGAAAIWRQLADVAKASLCSMDHQTPQELQCLIWDRLDPIIHRACESAEASAALTAIILDSEQAVGEEARFTCNHSAHRGRARPRTARGYQTWRLQTAEWLAVSNDPAGRERRAPVHVWTAVPRSARNLLIPQTRAAGLPRALGLISWDVPTPSDIERALGDLQQASPDLSLANNAAATTADRLLRKLESALTPEPADRDPVALPARNGTTRVWASAGVVPDIPGLEDLPGVDVVDVPIASRIRQVYGLRAMSETVTQHLHPEGTDELAALLPHGRRLEIMVLLGREGTDRKALALSLRALHEQPVRRIDLEVIMDGHTTHWSRGLPFKLIAEGQKTSLYVTVGAEKHRVRLAQVLADYLNLSQHANLLALILSNPDEMAESILDSELEEALELLEPIEGPDDGQMDMPIVRHAGDLDELEAQPDKDERVEAPGHEDRTSVSSGGEGGPKETPSPRAPRPTPTISGAEEHDLIVSPNQLEQAVTPSSPALADPQRAIFSPPVRASFSEQPVIAQGPGDSARTHNDDGRRPPFTTATGVPRSDEQAEQAAIEYVREYAKRELKADEVIDRQRDKCGWDLEFVYSNGRSELVEVKGSGGEGPFGLTANELRQARLNDNYVLYFLAEQRTGKPKLYRFDRLGELVKTEEHLRPSAWWVDGWKRLDPELIDISFG